MALTPTRRKLTPLDEQRRSTVLDADLDADLAAQDLGGETRVSTGVGTGDDSVTNDYRTRTPVDDGRGVPPRTEIVDGGGALGITELPDGAGGSVPVPPIIDTPGDPVPVHPITFDPNAGGPGITTADIYDPLPSVPVTPPELPTPTPPHTGAPTEPLPVPTPPPVAETPTTNEPGVPAPPSSGEPTDTFTEDDNLIDAQVLPTPDPRVLQFQGMTDEILNRLVSGPDRLAIARQYQEAFEEARRTGYERDLSRATNLAGAHGRIGSGQLTNQYGDLFEALERDKRAASQRYLTEALEGTIGDTQNAFRALSEAEDRAFGQGVSNRGETRGEREYQRNLAEQAIMRRILQRQMEQGENQQAFENALAMYGLGNQGDPTGAYQYAAQLEEAIASGNWDLVRQIVAAMGRGNQQPAAT